MTNETKHTPGPWRISNKYHIGAVNGPGPMALASVNDVHIHAEANARHIVACVNAHDDLVEALRAFVVTVEYLQRTTNPEEWATHGNWSALMYAGRSVLAKAQS